LWETPNGAIPKPQGRSRANPRLWCSSAAAAAASDPTGVALPVEHELAAKLLDGGLTGPAIHDNWSWFCRVNGRSLTKRGIELMIRHLLLCIVLALCIPTIASAEKAHATPRSLPLADLNQDELETYVNENVSIANGATQTILNANPGTPGYASSIWLTAESGPFMRQAILDVYVDGESTPSVTTDLSGFGTCASNTAGHWGTENVIIETEATNQPWEKQRYDITFRFPIPFKNSINITITNKTDSPVNFWSIAHYATGRNLGQKLWSAGRTEANRLKNLTPLQQGDGSVHFLKLASGAGVVVYHSMCWENWGGGTPNFLENNPVMYLDRRRPGLGIFPQVSDARVRRIMLFSLTPA
jgi:Protein of unknown function (DUF2961)